MSCIDLPPLYEGKHQCSPMFFPDIITDVSGPASKYKIPEITRSAGNIVGVEGCSPRKLNNMSSIQDQFRFLCIGDMPEDEVEMCYRVLNETHPILIPITHVSYNEDQRNTHYCDILGMGVKPLEEYNWYGEIQVYCNNPSHADLQRANDMILNNDRVSLYLVTENYKDTIALKGHAYGISYDINICDSLAEQWIIRIGLRDII